MKRTIQFFTILILLALTFSAAGLTNTYAAPLFALGTYPNTNVVLGGNTTVTPSAAPTGTTSISVYTNTNFKGTFVANTATGVVRIINAHPTGTYTVTVRAFGSSPTTTTFTLTVTSGVACAVTPTYSAPTNYAMGTQPYSVAVADFNNDGNQDMVTPNDGSNNASVRLGNGAGGFGTATNFTLGTRPGIVAVGDFNNDGNQDFATANENTTGNPGNVSVRLGNGAGSFSAVTNFAVGGARPWSIAVGDFNNDGNQDFVTANYTNNNVSILIGNGAGGFGAATNLTVGTGPWSVAVGDFNKDGNQDLVTANVTSNNISILLGNGAGGFGAATNLTVGTAPRTVAVGDFNNDGNQDLAVANANSNNVSILLGNGAGGFGAVTNYAVGTGPWSVAVGDFNNDGNQDFVTANWATNNVTIRLGNGAGGFGGATNFNSGGTQASAVAVGDFNNDARQDIAITNRGSNNITILLGYLPLCYNGNGNTGGTAPATVNYAPGATVTVSGNTGSLVKTNYTFDGWNTAADGSGISYAPAATFNITTPTILYAKWQPNTFTVTPSVGTGSGTISPNTPQTVDYNDTAAFTITPDLGYHIDSVGGTCGGSLVGNTYTTNAVTADCTVIATFAIDTFTITASAGANGSITPSGDTTVNYGDSQSYTITPDLGYHIVDVLVDGSSVGAVASYDFTNVTADHTISATFAIDTFTITASAGSNGSVTPSGNTVVNYGDSQSYDIAPDLGYHVVDVLVDGSSVGAVTTYDFTNVTADHTIEASFAATSYTVTFDANGGSAPVPTSKSVIFDSAYGTLAAASRTGYTFDGWFTAAFGGTEVTDATIVTTASDHILYAQWTVNQYTISFEENGGSAVADIMQDYGTPVTAPADPIRTGYIFDGWYTDDGTFLNVYTFSTMPAGNITLYAKWNANTYTVTFDGNGGGAPSPTSKLVTFDSAYGTLATVSRTGYTFDGWYDAASGGNVVTDATLVSTASDHTLYAHWTADSYTVTFDGNGGGTPSPTSKLVTYDNTYGTLATVSRTGYTFNGWFDAASGGNQVTAATIVSTTSDHTLYAQWTANTYTVAFDGNGGVAPSLTSKLVTYDSAYGTLAVVSRTGYTFDGWYDAASGGNMVTDATIVTTASNHTLYAQWTAIDYTVTYDGNGNDGGTVPTDNTLYNIGDTVTVLTDLPTRTGYTFAGWSDGTNIYQPNDTFLMGSDNVTLTTQWTVNAYTVTFDPQNGESTFTQSVNYGALVIEPTAPTLAGYTFAGWYNGAILWDFAADTMGAGDMTLTAHWTAIDYTVTYDGNGNDGGTVPTDNNTYIIGDTVTVLTGIPTLTGYTFSGWRDGTNIYQPNDTFLMGSASVTLTAQWTVNNYTVRFDPQGGAPTPSDQSVAYGALVSDPGDPTRSGYTFNGWFTASSGGSQWNFASDTMGAADMTIYAQWTVNQYTITFDSNGGSPVADITQDYGTIITAPADPILTGYNFAGWFTDDDTFLNAYSFSTMPAENLTLYAKWVIGQYSIFFNSNGGSAVPPITQDYGTPVIAPADPTRTGYTFGGWYTDDGTFLNAYVFTTMPAENVSLYAKWTVNQYTISFNSNGGSAVADITQDYGTPVTAPADPVRTDYTFHGWYTDNGTFLNAYIFSTMPAENITLYARWTANIEISATFTSVANYDGFLLESGENTGVGGLANAVSPLGIIGDHMQDRQFRGLLHFDTSSLPDNAVITSITLSIRRPYMHGGPFISLGSLQVDIASPFFGAEMTLKPADFQAAPAFAAAGAFNPVPAVGNWHSAILDPASFSSINLAGPTQFRLAFSIEDDDDMTSDLILFYSGNYRIAAYRPVLVITYYIP